MTILEVLKAAGAKVRITHFRPFRWEAPYAKKVLYSRYDLNRMGAQGAAFASRGGMTIAVIEWPDGTAVCAVSLCSDKDNFCRRTGRDTALARALGLLPDLDYHTIAA